MSNCFSLNWLPSRRLTVKAVPVSRCGQRHFFPAGAGKRRLGAAATEFAIVAPVFFLMIIGFIEFGRALMVQQVLINASREGQRAMKEIIGVYLKRIEWDAKGLPIKLYPFTRDTQAEAAPASDPRVVVMNPEFPLAAR